MSDLPVMGRFSLEEVSRRGAARYAELKPEIESSSWNRYIAIDTETGDYAISERKGDAMRAMHARYPDGQSYLRKIGSVPEPRLAERIWGGGSHGGAAIPQRKE